MGKYDCNECKMNIGIEEGASRIVGPCGQQHCWKEIEAGEDCCEESDDDDEERKNLLSVNIAKGGCTVGKIDGKIYFSDNQCVEELTEIPAAVYWDEHEGYTLADGRNLDAIIVKGGKHVTEQQL